MVGAKVRYKLAVCLSCLVPIAGFLVFSQVSKGVQDRTVSAVPAAQVYTAQTLYMFPLAFSKPAKTEADQEAGRDF